MKAWIGLIIIIILALWLGLQFHHDNGQVVINYGSWSIETSVWVAALIILLGFILFYGLLRLIQQTQLWPRRLLTWGRVRKRKKMLALTQQGVNELIESKWQHAEQHLDKAAPLSPLPVINYLGAAYAACQQGSYQNSGQHLQKIQQTGLLSPFQTRLLQMQLYMAHDQWELVEFELPQLYQQHPKDPQVTYLLTKFYQHRQDWLALAPLLDSLQRQQLLPAKELSSLALQSYRAQLYHAREQHDIEALTRIWRGVPPTQQVELLPDYTQDLLALKQDQQVVILIERSLKQHWRVDLLKSYAQATSNDLYKQIAQAENWLSKHPNCAELYSCLGILSMRCQLWGKAKEYLTASLNLKASAPDYYALGQVHEALNEKDLALQHYRQGLSVYTQPNET